MGEIDSFIVDKLIDNYCSSAREIGWLLYNRKESLDIDELNRLGKLIIQALDEEYKAGEDAATEGVEHIL